MPPLQTALLRPHRTEVRQRQPTKSGQDDLPLRTPWMVLPSLCRFREGSPPTPTSLEVGDRSGLLRPPPICLRVGRVPHRPLDTEDYPRCLTTVANANATISIRVPRLPCRPRTESTDSAPLFLYRGRRSPRRPSFDQPALDRPLPEYGIGQRGRHRDSLRRASQFSARP